MNLREAKQQFIQSWGVLGSQWGINRTMAQVHALLLVSKQPLSTDNVMEELNISRGNANMNLRELMDWGLIEKIIVSGDRKEYFSAEKDIWRVATLIMAQRKKKELDPMLKVLNQLAAVELETEDAEALDFHRVIGDIRKVAGHAEKTVDTIIRAEESWFLNSFFKLLRK